MSVGAATTTSWLLVNWVFIFCPFPAPILDEAKFYLIWFDLKGLIQVNAWPTETLFHRTSLNIRHTRQGSFIASTWQNYEAVTVVTRLKFITSFLHASQPYHGKVWLLLTAGRCSLISVWYPGRQLNYWCVHSSPSAVFVSFINKKIIYHCLGYIIPQPGRCRIPGDLSLSTVSHVKRIKQVPP